MKITTAIYVITFIVASASAFPANAATYYVGPSGNDTGGGTLAAPWKTLQKAANTAKAGDLVLVRKGAYSERVDVKGSGTAALPIVFRAYPGETPVIDLSSVPVTSGFTAAFAIRSKNYVVVDGFEICHYATNVSGTTIAGIMVTGTSTGVSLLNNKIHHIQQNNTTLFDYGANAHGIVVYGTSNTPLKGIVIQGNTLRDLRLGASEAVSLNGNVTHFTVIGNTIYNCNNIGIDAIGYEGICPSASLDRARDGVIAGNTVYNIDSAYNPAYGGSFTKGGGYQAAVGIYVDGGARITIERNNISRCNYGVELAAEARSGATEDVIVRNNLILFNQLSGITLGGYDHLRGTTKNCSVINNTFYKNGTTSAWSPQIQFQYYARNNTVANNIVWGRSDSKLMISQWPEEGTSSQKDFSSSNTFAYNLYYAGGSTAVVFQIFSGGKQKAFTGLAEWRLQPESRGELGSTVQNPRFAVAVPSSASSANAYKLSVKSPAIGTGQPLLPSAAKWGDFDFFRCARFKGDRVDRGMAER